jgi:glutamate/tyrosine decarboxylase-like PLP-dependent enzyme
MQDLQFENELCQILDKYDDSWKNDSLDGDDVDRLIEHLRNQLNLINGNITNKEYEDLEEIDRIFQRNMRGTK